MGVLALGSCTRGSDELADTRTAVEWTVDPEPLVTIGAVDGAAAYIFARIAAVRLLADGRIVVADGSSGTIRIYSSDGVFERQMGGSGAGPGEFRYLSALRIAPPDTIIAYDWEAYRLTKFLTTGQLVSTLAFRASDGYPELYLGSYSDGSHALAWIKQVPRDPSVVIPDVMQLGRFGADGRFMSLLETAYGMRRRLNGPLPFSAHYLAVMIGDTIFHTDGLGGLVEAIGPTGERVRTFNLPIEEWDVDEARRRLEAELDGADLQRLRELEGTPGLDSIPTLAALLSDDQGHLWVKRYDPATDSHWVWRERNGGEWLVLESDGTVIAHVSMPTSVRLVEISGDRVAGIALDDFGVERVQVFALRRGRPAT